MTADQSSESHFIDAAEAFDFFSRESGPAMQALEDWYARFKAELDEHVAPRVESHGHRSLARQLALVRSEALRYMQSWPGQWARLQDADALADVFDDRVLVLVVGKFNAGKSSFCNFIADRYLAHGKTVSWFRLDNGRIVEASERLREGGTETTTDVQGVRLGDKLLLLDTPGLHSVSKDNAELTRRFTESADLMLWLTSSTSPGQVQELQELGRELHRNKVLLPVVTRSDVYEEDEIDGELKHYLRNKTEHNRALQEADVLSRARDKLVAMQVDPHLVKAPVSVSVLAAREQGLTNTALSEAGFERFYDTLLAAAGPALAYKRRKRAEVFLHFLEEVVSGAMLGDVQALLTALNESSQAELDRLGPALELVERAVWRRIMPTLPEQLERHAATMDADGLGASVSISIHSAFIDALKEHGGDYDVVLTVGDARLELDEDARYEGVTIDEDDALWDGPGMSGVSWERLFVSLETAMRATLRRLSDITSAQGRAAIRQVWRDSSELEGLIARYAKELDGLKLDLRSTR